MTTTRTLRSPQNFLFSLLLGLALTDARAAGTIAVRLDYGGEPLTSMSKPEFSLRGPQGWMGIDIQPNGDGTFTMQRPAPGRYMIHAEIDEDKSNPGNYPGDYNVFQEFEVTDTEPAQLSVPMSRLLHVTAPWDNAKGLDGMLTAPFPSKPLLEMPRFRLTLPLVFRWEPVTSGAQYRYTLSRASPGGVVQLLQKDTPDTTVTLHLAPSAPGTAYQFNLFATKNGHTVGTLFIHDAGAQGWALYFRVGPRWPPIAVLLTGVAVLMLLAFAWKTRGRAGAAASAIALLTLLVAGGYWWQTTNEPTAPGSGRGAHPTPPSKRAGVDRALVDEFKRTVPLPGWWGQVEPELPIRNLTDLQSVWMSGGTMNSERGRRFYKSAYKAMEDYPEEPDLVPYGLYLMSVVAEDPATTLALREFWLKKFFHYEQRVDNCANCMVGDTASTMARDYAAAGRYTNPSAGIETIQRLVRERERDISPYNLALTLQEMARNQWQMCDKPGALASLKEGLRRFPSGWQADEIRRTLTEFEASEPHACFKPQ